jgi:hypothetical protein
VYPSLPGFIGKNRGISKSKMHGSGKGAKRKKFGVNMYFLECTQTEAIRT